MSVKNKIFLFFLISYQIVFSQSVEILGQIKNKMNFENVYVINKISGNFTITNHKGEFKISAEINDTLIFSSIIYEPLSLVVDNNIYLNKTIVIELKEKINVLEEVFVGNVLTGNLKVDSKNIDIEIPLSAEDVGIAEYKGKRLTQSERRLYTAGEFKPIMLLGILGGSLEVDPIINGISGKTKRLKERVDLESNYKLMNKIKFNLSTVFFDFHELDKIMRDDFFYFCEESTDFKERCYLASEIEILKYLEEKLILYKKNMGINQCSLIFK